MIEPRYDEARPLSSIPHEMSLLGAMLLSDAACAEALRAVREEAFYRPSHRMIFRAMGSLVKRSREVDPVSLREELIAQGNLANVGGQEYLNEIDLYVPSASNWPTYAEEILEKSRMRSLEQTFRQGIGKIHDFESDMAASQIAAWAATEVNAIGGATTGAVSMEEIDETGGDPGLRFGIPQIERVLGTEGTPGGQMTVVVAKEKHGKSALKIQMAVHQAQQGLGVMYVSLADLNPKRLKRRMLRCMSGWSERPNNPHYAERFDLAKEQLERDMALTIVDRTRSGGADVDDILSGVETFRQRHENGPTPLEAVYVDYAQKLTSREFRANDPLGMTTHCSKQISAYAERTGLSLVVGSQLTDGNEKEGRDPMTKGGRCWLEDCGLALWIQRGEGFSATLQVLRSRFGGMGTKVPMIYDDETLSFRAVNA